MILESFRQNRMEVQLPKKADIAALVEGSLVILGEKTKCGFNQVDVRVWSKCKTKTGFDFTGDVLSTGNTINFNQSNILEISAT